MKRLLRNLFLSILIVFPLFIFLFLYGFGQNEYSLEIYFGKYIEEVSIDGEIFYDTLINPSSLEGKKIVDTVYHTIPDFSFIDQNGKAFDQKEVQGKIHVADFFFTRCGNPTLCPRMGAELKRVQNYLKDDPEVEIVSYTVDPEYDTPEVLQAYAQSYEADPEQWHFLTGDKKQIYDLAFRGYRVNAMEEGSSVNPDFLHATKFILVDKQGRIRGYYEGIDAEEVDRLMLEIDILKSEYQ